MYLFKKSIAILISGRAGVGKSLTAKLMKEYLDTLKLKSAIFPFAFGVKQSAEFMGWDKNKDEKGRQLLIDVGMAGRKYDPDLWCKTTFKYIIPEASGFPFDFVLVDDCRFENEINYVKNDWTYQTFTVRVISPDRECLKGTPQYDDISETSLTNEMDYNYYILNLFSLEELKERAEQIIKDIIDKAEKI